MKMHLILELETKTAWKKYMKQKLIRNEQFCNYSCKL